MYRTIIKIIVLAAIIGGVPLFSGCAAPRPQDQRNSTADRTIGDSLLFAE